VPTPFYHLNVAEALLAHSNLLYEIKSLIDTYRFAFLFGHVAPDVQVVSGQARESTHFYAIPTRPEDILPWERMLNKNSSLACVEQCGLEQAVFVAGYQCHLQADWFWARQIFEPYFGPGSHWKTFRERLYLHNVLRSYLDYQVVESLTSETCFGLARVKPKSWLTFVELSHLEAWRDFLANQLKPGAPIHTVEVFASRQGVSVDNYLRILNAEDEMQLHVFDYLPRQLLETYRRGVLTGNVKLLNEYLAKYVGG